MKARRFLLAAVLSVVGCVFAFAGCGEKADDGHEHTYEWEITTPATCQQEGERKGTCTICGKETTETLEKTGHTLEGEPTVITPSTCLVKGKGTKKCSVCGTDQPVDLDLAPHTLTHHEGVQAACNADGSIEYWSCSVCGRNFSDEAGTSEALSTLIPKETVPHDYNERGVCNVCGAARTDTSEHICTPIKVNEVPSDCKTEGVKEHYECKGCGKLYLDADATQETTLEALKIEVSKDHNAAANAVYYDEVESKSCLQYGKKARWDCKVCGRHFKDKDLTQEYAEVGADGVCNENTLQTPKSDVHANANGNGTWDYHGDTSNENGNHRLEPTCTSVGWKEGVYVCNVCGLIFRDEEFDTQKNKAKINEETGEPYAPLKREDVVIDIDPSKHSVEKQNKSTEPTKCGDENATYKVDCYKCKYCGKYFDNENCTTELKRDEVLNFGNHGTMTEINESNSTCQEHGHPHCWECGSCGEHFSTKDPAASTVPLSDEEYNLPLAPHAYTLIKYNSKGHWSVCKDCGIDEMDEDGVLKIEEHVTEGDGDPTCVICGFGGMDFTQFFTFDYSSDRSYAIITGFEKDKLGNVLLADSTETVLRIPEATNDGTPITEIAAGALSSDEPHKEYLNAYKNIEEIYIPASITTIGDGAFRQSWYDTKVRLIEFETSTDFIRIGAEAFSHLTSLKRITLPKKLKTFPSGLFSRCLSLTTVNMPEEIEESTLVLEKVFFQCTGLKTIDLWCLEDKSYQIGKQTFSGCDSLETIYLPAGLTRLGGACMANCPSIEKIYFGGLEEEWTAVSKMKSGEEKGYDAWNYNTLVLKDENWHNILVYGYTH